MAQLLYHELPADEREDFEAACKDSNWIPQDFTVVAEEGVPIGQGIGPIPRGVTVEVKASGHRQYYDAGNGTSWTAEFERDLMNGSFGQPPKA